MAGRKLNAEGKRYEKLVSDTRLGGNIAVPAKITPNFMYVAYGMKQGYRYIALEGSSRSGKTYATLQWIVCACLSPKTFIKDFNRDKLEVRCFRHDAVNARDSIWADLNTIIEEFNIKNGVNGFNRNETRMTWVFPNGSTIVCGGANDPAKLHGLGQDIVYFNEAMMIMKGALDQTEMRTRIGYIFDWNPSLNDHWIFKNGFDKTSVYGKDERLPGRPKCLYAHSTYKDNPYLTEFQIAAIEQYEVTDGNVARGTADKYMWDVYGLGKRGYLEGRVIAATKVDIIPDEEFPTAGQWELHGYGLDWGFSNDPTALIECAIFNKKLYVRELIYETGLMITPDSTLPNEDSVIGKLRRLGIKKNDTIVADSARPDLNAALRNAGFLVMDAYKPGGSIENGVNLMNQRRWCVCDGSYNLKFELENWIWAKSRYGEQMRKPVDKFNHAMDAIRYWLSSFIDSGNLLKVSEFNSEKADDVEYACVIDIW